MRHLKQSSSNWNLKNFLTDNTEYIILGAIMALGMLIGVKYNSLFSDYFDLSSNTSFIGVALSSVFEICICIFLIYFCGTSSLGFLSPLVLLYRGALIGKSVVLSLNSDFWIIYLLSFLPYTVLTSAILIFLCKNNIVISLRLFKISSGLGSFDITDLYKRFTAISLLILGASVIICLIYALTRVYIVSWIIKL